MKTDRKRTGRIGFQGAQGANSEIASRQVFPKMEPLPFDTFEDVFNALDAGKVDLAMIPIENSLAGRVADIHHLMPQHKTWIIGEHFLPIRFNLMALPGVRIRDIRTVYSHVHALGQCRKIIRKHRWKAEVGGDTAGSAKLVAERGDRTIAALAPALAADVEDEAHNTTRFLILSKKKELASAGKGPVITTFLFQVRNIPAALYKAMGGFATNGVNMTKLESYQLGGAFTATQFYADIEGHPDETPVNNALEELQFFCDKFRILGIYPKDGER